MPYSAHVTDAPDSGRELASHRTIADLISNHLALATTLLLVILVVARVLVVSHFSTTTALGILAESPTTQVAVGSLAGFFPALLLLAFSAAATVAHAVPAPGWVSFALLMFALLLLIGLIVAAPWFAGVLGLATFAVTVLATVAQRTSPTAELWMDSRIERWLTGGAPLDALLVQHRDMQRKVSDLADDVTRHEEARSRPLSDDEDLRLRADLQRIAAELHEIDTKADEQGRIAARVHRRLAPFRLVSRTVETRAVRAIGENKGVRYLATHFVPIYLAFISVLVLVGLLFAPMWLPAERIETRSGTDLVGYVLSTDDASIVVMRESDRALVRLELSELLGQAFCSVEPQSRPLWRPWDSSNYPDCT